MQWYVQNVSLQVHFTLCIAVDNYWSCKLVMSREVLVEANCRINDSNLVPVWYRYCSNTVQLQHTVATVSGSCIQCSDCCVDSRCTSCIQCSDCCVDSRCTSCITKLYRVLSSLYFCSVMKCNCVEGTPTLTTELSAWHWSLSETGISHKFYVIGCGFVPGNPLHTVAIPFDDKMKESKTN
jgi:hypothetical protein